MNDDPEFIKWRPVLAEIATLQEVETHWSLGDLIECNEILDHRDYLKKNEADKNDRGNRR